MKISLSKFSTSNESLKYLENRILDDNYRGDVSSQHNRWTFDDLVFVLGALQKHKGDDDLLKIRTTDKSKRPANFSEEFDFASFCDEVVSKIGDVLKENPELVDALKSGNITEVVAQVRSKMGAATSGAVVEPETGDSPASSAPSNAGAGPSVGGGASNAGQSAFSDLVASNGNLARQLVANIRSQNLDEAAFRLQFKQFNDRIASLQSQPDANQLEIEELKAQSAAAKEILDNPVANGDPFDTIEL